MKETLMKRLLRSLKRQYLHLTNPSIIAVEGVKLAVKKGEIPDGVRGDLFRDRYEHSERQLVKRVLRPGMRVLEIGTGIGFISILATRLSGEGNVRSYEANRLLEDVIRRNYALNNLRPNLRMRAVTPDGLPVTFFREDNIIASSVYDLNTHSTKDTVESDAFAEILSEFDPSVLIMDVEGAEVDLLDIRNFGSLRHMIVELHPHIVGQEKITALIERLEDAGFAVSDRDRKTVYLQRFD